MGSRADVGASVVDKGWRGDGAVVCQSNWGVWNFKEAVADDTKTRPRHRLSPPDPLPTHLLGPR